ncbi:hypothetical protein [Aquimarina sp. 2201CG5-10]|uniref:hypothetical protein n=1 Tax=Aquimarina callyspongiae TaxID=3098150 RepID=UPI002AB4EAF9|nr:hypothetical protein [Aquimarina sp. 2201CG5-10]MDY8134340.1 hypothetical protein [Aquimarina sp. 2201CG5-10]
MKTIQKIMAFTAIILFTIGCKTNTDNDKILAVNSKPTTTKRSINIEEYTLPGASIMTFGPNNVLFVGDSKSAVVHALSTEAIELKDPVPYNLRGIDRKIAEKLGIAASDVVIQDMKIHPVSQEAYISVKRGYAPDAKSLIAIVSPKTGDVRFFNVAKAEHTKIDILGTPENTPNFWRDIPAYTLTITDLDFHKNNLYVSGLSNGEFASTLRVIPYPFNGKQTKVNSIEMFHTVHVQNETRAPIRTMLFQELNGVETLIAAYTCTPLVTFPVSQITENGNMKSKTVAELGYGNVPIDMLVFDAQDFEGKIDKKLLIINKNRSGSIISIKDLEKANLGKGLTTYTDGPEGLPIFPVPLSGVMHIDDQNPMLLTVLRRNIDKGTVDLLSELKGTYFRLSDFINEFDFTDYKYPKGAELYKNYHNMSRPLEGYPELVRKN